MGEKLELYTNEKSFGDLVEDVIDIFHSKRTPIVWGIPGIGKSALAKYVADRMGCDFKCLDAPLLQPFDYAVAVPNHDKKEIELYRTGFIPEKGPCVVAIEDLPHAKPYQQTPIMQIALDHRIGPLKFADDVYFIASGNREEDLAFTQPLSSPLKNRFFHLYLKPDPEEWAYKFARPNNLDERVIGFALSNSTFFAQRPKEDGNSWSTPRTLHMFSDVIKNITGTSEHDESRIRSLGIGSIGPEATKFFMEWMKYLRHIDPRDVVINGNMPKMSRDDRSQMFAVVLSIGSYIASLDEPELIKHGKNILSFTDIIPSDYTVLFAHQFVEYDKRGTKNIDKLETLQKIPGSNKLFRTLTETLLDKKTNRN